LCERGKKLAHMQKCMAQTQILVVDDVQARVVMRVAGLP
jgi:hypothetical protein